MRRLASKWGISARGEPVVKVHESAISPGLCLDLPRLSLTFGGQEGLTPAILGKMFFSTRRPALEAGGERPTARCALGRKSVWNWCHRSVAEARSETQVKASSPAKAGDPVTD